LLPGSYLVSTFLNRGVAVAPQRLHPAAQGHPAHALGIPSTVASQLAPVKHGERVTRTMHRFYAQITPTKIDEAHLPERPRTGLSCEVSRQLPGCNRLNVT